jgi:DNA (cytosine-5)-methyltransferase 1
MIYGSVCSGIEAATVAWHDLGWTPAWFSEIEPFPCKVLKYRYPHVPNLGNMLSLTENKTFNNGKIDLLVGGTPCQSFSVAGLRRGLTDERGNLALEFCRLLIAKQPQWFVWENVPGALSSFSDPTQQSDEETSDFAAILAAFRECGYCCAWRVLDAQFFGVPQRRRRIFVVGYLGNDWRPPAKVLFERESLFWDIAPGGKKGKKVTGDIDSRIKSSCFQGEHVMNNHAVPVAFQSSQSGVRLSNTHATLDRNNGSRRYNGVLIPCWWDGGQVSQTLDRVLSKDQTMPEKNRFPAVLCYPYNQITSPTNRSNPQFGDPAPTLGKTENAPLLIPHVRRLTPMECERLQGFPDNYTLIPGASDTVRYQAIGNSMAVPVMAKIGNSINHIHKLINNNA